eukprot:1472319-Alexandrium_andersonii.AAC.1
MRRWPPNGRTTIRKRGRRASEQREAPLHEAQEQHKLEEPEDDPASAGAPARDRATNALRRARVGARRR